jgi:hypothetical protein
MSTPWIPTVLEAHTSATEADGQGEIAVTGGGVSQLVPFEEVDAAASVQSQVSANFLTKYAADGFAGAMNEDVPLGATLRLLPL